MSDECLVMSNDELQRAIIDVREALYFWQTQGTGRMKEAIEKELFAHQSTLLKLQRSRAASYRMEVASDE